MQMTLTQTDVRGTEDCLYLNIWIPQGRRQGMCLAETWGGDSRLPFVDKLLQSYIPIVGNCRSTDFQRER